MKAVAYRTPGPIDRPDALIDLDLPAPQPGPRDLLVRVRAISVNPVDAKVRASAQPAADLPGGARVLGWDAVGTVERWARRRRALPWATASGTRGHSAARRQQ